MQAGGDDQLFKENNKKFIVDEGSIDFKVTSVCRASDSQSLASSALFRAGLSPIAVST